MKKWLLGLACVGMLATAAMGQTAWFNEVNYDPVGTDVAGSEWLEVAGPAGTDLSSYVVVRYNGNGGVTYGTTTLAGTIDDEGCGYGAVELVYPGADSLQNGAPDGLALAQVSGGVTTLVQFLSYEGTFLASNGPAIGVTSVDIGTQFSSTNHTLQLVGTATNYDGFAWATNVPSMGTLNPGQTITGCTPVAQTNVYFYASGALVNEDQGSVDIMVYKTLAEGNVSGQIALSGTATEGGGADYTVDSTNFTMNGATTSATITVTINDDADSEAAETIVMNFANMVGAGTTAPATHTLTINASDQTAYGIAITPPTNGTVTTTPATEAIAGATVTINATPSGGYSVGTKTVVGDDATPITVTGNTFTMPAQPVTVTVLFVEAAATRLVISQYTETETGTIPKGIEIWNVSGSDITFDGAGNLLDVKVGANGGVPASAVTGTNGTLAAGDVWVIGTTNMTPDLVEPFTFNGDDAIVLELGGVLQDVIGTVGVDPGTAWTSNGVSTANQNIQLKSGITAGDVDGWSDPSERFEYVAAGSDLTGFGIAPGGSATFSVTFNKTSGFTVEQGTSDSVFATAANGIAPYTYGWTSSLGGTHFTADTNRFTILATAPVGDYSATVVATDMDSPAKSVTNSLNFSVVAPAVKYAIGIVTNNPGEGTVTTTPATEAAAGVAVTINIVPADGYRASSVVVNGGAVAVVGNTFTMPAEAATVTVTFEAYDAPDVLIDFETNTTLSGSAYTAGTSLVNNVSFAHQRVLRGSLANDRVHGIYSGRFYPQTGTNAILATTAAFAEPITKISLWYANYGSDNGTTFKVQVSPDGATWEDVGSVIDPESTNLTEVVMESIPANATYLQIITVAGTTRVSIDDIGLWFGVPTFSVSVNKSNGFVVNQGASDSITATAANGTAPYSYSWTSTLGASYRTTNVNLFTILATAPTGSYSATVTATDSLMATAQRTVTFSVVGVNPGDPAVLISGSLSGTVGVEMALTITITNETANDWYIDLKDPDGLDDVSYGFAPPSFTLTPTKTGTYVLTATADTGSGLYSNRVNLAVSDSGDIWTIGGTGDGGAMFTTSSNIIIILPTNYTLNAVYGQDSSAVGMNNLGQGLGPLTQGIDYTWTPATRTVTILNSATNRRIVRVGANPPP